MPRTLSSLLIASKNKLESTQPWTLLYELDINNGAGTFRIVNYDKSIVFHGLTFLPFPVSVSGISESDAGNINSMTLTTSNVDQQIIALLETYWNSVVAPLWRVSIWRIDATMPNETPLDSKELYEVVSVATDLLSASFELRWEGITMTRRVPGRRYTRTAGFGRIPRLIR